MPSLPVNNQSLSSQEDAYRRYFGALKKSSPTSPRSLLCTALAQIIILSLLLSIPNFTMLYLFFEKFTIYNSKHLYYLHNLTQMFITFLWCISVIYVIFKHQYANFKIMLLSALFISLISLSASTYLSYLYHVKDHGIIHTNIINTTIWRQDYWKVDIMYFFVFRFPLTLYFSILIMYVSQYCCSCPCLFIISSRFDSYSISQQLKQKLINLPDDTGNHEAVEVFEYISNTTGTAYGGDDDEEFSVSDDIYNTGGYEIKEQYDCTHIVTFQELEKAARSVVTRYMALYCLGFMITLALWFLIITTDPSHYGNYRLPLYCMLLFVYYIAKCGLKRSARQIDTAIIIVNFSFEIVTEILMSTFYWVNFRMFTVRYPFNRESTVWSMCGIGTIHILGEIFQDSIRMNAGYFNWTGNMSRLKKSNITQWKVRGAIDTAIRFIISIYSIVFVSIRYIAYPQNIVSKKDRRNSIILNYSVFMVELIYFSFILFKPGCAGKISHQQQLNMAEPLMRIFNANRILFLAVFCGSMVMASFLVV